MMAALATGIWSRQNWFTSPLQNVKLDAAMSFPDHLGSLHNLSEWQGKWLVVNFWAPWCAPCLEEIPLFAEAQAKLGKEGLQIIGIALDSSVNVAQYLAAKPANYPMLMGNAAVDTWAATLGNVQGVLPYTVIFAPDGHIAHTKMGAFHKTEFADIVKELIQSQDGGPSYQVSAR